VRRWLASSPSGSDAAWAWALLPVGVVVGVAAEGAGFSWDDAERWVPDLVVGLTFIGAGAYALPRQRGCGALLAATGLTWFAGTVDVSALYLHRGPLVQLLVAYPGWRPRTRTGLVAVAAGYAAALARPVWGDDATAVVLRARRHRLRRHLRRLGIIRRGGRGRGLRGVGIVSGLGRRLPAGHGVCELGRIGLVARGGRWSGPSGLGIVAGRLVGHGSRLAWSTHGADRGHQLQQGLARDARLGGRLRAMVDRDRTQLLPPARPVPLRCSRCRCP